MSDLDLLKAVTDREVSDWGPAEEVVTSVLSLLHEGYPGGYVSWDDIYHAVKAAYVPPASWASWGDGDEED